MNFRPIPILTIALAAGAQTVRMIEVDGDARKYWPRWRGPSGQGIVEGAGYPDTWSDTENVLWKVAVARTRPFLPDRLEGSDLFDCCPRWRAARPPVLPPGGREAFVGNGGSPAWVRRAAVPEE